MPSLALDLSPYSFTGIALIIIGLISTLYRLRLKEKTAATWRVTLALASFTLAMVSMLSTNLVLWGSALSPLTDACAVLSMAAAIDFG